MAKVKLDPAALMGFRISGTGGVTTSVKLGDKAGDKMGDKSAS
jgi:hypothetical protein